MIDNTETFRQEARYKAYRTMCSYGGGKLPLHSTDPFSLAHWYGSTLYELDKNYRGIDLVVEKNMDEGFVISYNPECSDNEINVLYGLALQDLGFLKWESPVKIYTWGCVCDPLEKVTAMAYAEQLLDYCKIGLGVV